MKETFIVRTEWQDAIFELEPTDQAIILQNLFHYHTDNENLINLNNLNVKLVWKLIEPNLKRNIISYDRRKDTSRENGKLGGRPPIINKLQEPNNLSQEPNNLLEPNETLSVSDSVIVSDINKKRDIYTEKEKEGIEWVIKMLNELTGKNFRATNKATAQLIVARMREGRTGANFKHVIEVKTKQWKGTEDEKYLRPETLFNATKFEGYVNESLTPELNGEDKKMAIEKAFLAGL